MKQVLTVLAIFFFVPAHAQADPLRVGDRVPQSVLSPVAHATAGKAVIIDFWGTYCAPCIKSMPMLDSMQELLDPWLKIVLVTQYTDFETPARVAAALAANGRGDGRPFHFFVLKGDTTLAMHFPHAAIPYYSWIDSDGVLSHLTCPGEMTSRNIMRFLRGEPFKVDDFPADMSETNWNQIIFSDRDSATRPGAQPAPSKRKKKGTRAPTEQGRSAPARKQ
ncbi:MAG: hypothetical protein JWP27_1750 [Flaviaesturariibacter sp.]|nr:hypothetical protein [Flaviaesturariibacter sp.]